MSAAVLGIELFKLHMRISFRGVATETCIERRLGTGKRGKPKQKG